MEVKALVLTLPNPDKFYVLKLKMAKNDAPIKWSTEYRERLFTMQTMVKDIARGTSTIKLDNDEKEALYNKDLSPKEAEESIECVWVDADTSRKTPLILDRYEDSVVVGGVVGYGVPEGMERYVLVTDGTGALLTRDMVQALDKQMKGNWTAVSPEGKEVPLSRYEPGYEVINSKGKPVNFDLLEMRRDQRFYLQAKRFKSKGLAGDRSFRFLTIPYGYKVSIVNSRGREVLREVPKQWS